MLRTHVIASTVALTLGLSLGSPDAHARTLGAADGINTLIFNDYSASGGDTEGRLFVGHDASLTGYSVGVVLSNSHGTRDDFVVGHNMNTSNWTVYNGNAVYGNAVTTAPSTPNGSTRKATVFDFNAAKLDLTSASTYWGSLASNGSAVYQFSTYTLTGSSSTLNIFNVTASDWAAASSHVINAPTGSTVLVNIAGLNDSMSNGMSLSGVDVTHVLFNFYQATTLNISSMGVLGSVLAPNATLTLSGGNINGQTIVNNASTINGGEFHNYAFTGDLPSVASVPEPASLTLLTLTAAAFLRRRRQHVLAV
jgi:choice-of-anchor A domain-containing protein